MRFVCESCRAQYMINDEKVGPKGVKVRCRKCGYVILVKKSDVGAKTNSGPQLSDPDDGMATQVMQSPLAHPEATLAADEHANEEDMTNPGIPSAGMGASSPTLQTVKGEAKPGDSFFGADEDEIGAVFDQVLKSGGTVVPKEGVFLETQSSDDRESTRVIDAAMVRKLAQESSDKVEGAGGGPVDSEPKAPEEVPQSDWYVAINEKQTGPLSLEKVKEHWDRGEISPDSLCWRPGFNDWIPVSTVEMLATVLAPKPPKPIVVAPTVTVSQGNAVVSVPVQSAFSAGGMVQTVQSEMQVPMSASGALIEREDTGSWKPSAASALASLVKDEMDALAKPPPKATPPPSDDLTRGGILDLPSGPHQDERVGNGAAAGPAASAPMARPPPPPVNPYMANPGATFSAPAVTQYRPPSNRGLMIGLAAGGAVMLLVLVGLIVFLATRNQQIVVQAPTPTPAPPTQVAAVVPAPTPTPTPAPSAAVAPTAATPTAAPAQPQPGATPTTAAVAPGTASPNPNPPPTSAVDRPSRPTRPGSGTGSSASHSERAERPSKAEATEPEPPPRKPASSGDDFESAFGSPSKSSPKEEAPKPEKKPAGYIPPAPGAGGDVKESLGQSDVMEVVLANKPALAKCVTEQRAKDPGTSGKLMMKWTIQTSGKTSNVSVVSDEFKGAPIANCVGSLIKGMTFPRHKKQGEPVTFPFKF